MKSLYRLLLVLIFACLPAATAAAQATPEAASGDPSPFAMGIGETATYMDARGNPVFEIVITAVDRGFEIEDSYYQPDRGQEFVSFSVSITNLGNRATTVSPYGFIAVDSMGIQMNSAMIWDSEEYWATDIPIDGGETVEGKMLFTIFTDLDPMLIMWQPDWDGYVFIFLGD